MWQKLRDWFAGSADSAAAQDEPVLVATCDGPLAADLLVSQLIDAGIPAVAIGSDSATVFGVQGGLLAEVRVIVPAAHAEAARAIIADNEEADDEAFTAPDADTQETPDQ